MKKVLLIIITPCILLAQNATIETLMHDNIERSYILYVPSSYDGTNSVPLVLNLHGYTSNAGEQMIYSKFYEIADVEGFILIHPEGTANDFGLQFWNIADFSEIDDVGFLRALIDSDSYKNLILFVTLELPLSFTTSL